MKSLHLALEEYKTTPKEFKPHLCFDEETGKYIVITFSNPSNISKLCKLKVIL
jgi:hypothetical protein